MKEYNWREERKKYQPGFRQEQENVPQSAPPVPPPKRSNKGVIFAVAVVLVVVVAACLFLRPASEVKKSELITIDQDSNTVMIRKKTTTSVQPQNIQLPSFSSSNSGQSFEAIAEMKKYAVGVVTIYAELDDKLIAKFPIGSAWAFSPNQFATNAHVVDGFFETRNVQIAKVAIQLALQDLKLSNLAAAVKKFGKDKAFQLISSYVPSAIKRTNFSVRILINQQAMKSCQITAVQIHPDYKSIHSPDVAVVTVREPHNHYFKLASLEKLYNLKAGRHIAFLGFPMSYLSKGNLNVESPIATLQSGAIVAVSDFDLKQSLPQNNHWIRHNLPSTGGASGSVIFDEDGEAVAILNSGHTDPDGRPNAVQINGALRIDLLQGVGRKVPIERWLTRGISPTQLIANSIKAI